MQTLCCTTMGKSDVRLNINSPKALDLKLYRFCSVTGWVFKAISIDSRHKPLTEWTCPCQSRFTLAVPIKSLIQPRRLGIYIDYRLLSGRDRVGGATCDVPKPSPLLPQRKLAYGHSELLCCIFLTSALLGKHGLLVRLKDYLGDGLIYEPASQPAS